MKYGCFFMLAMLGITLNAQPVSVPKILGTIQHGDAVSELRWFEGPSGGGELSPGYFFVDDQHRIGVIDRIKSRIVYYDASTLNYVGDYSIDRKFDWFFDTDKILARKDTLLFSTYGVQTGFMKQGRNPLVVFGSHCVPVVATELGYCCFAPSRGCVIVDYTGALSDSKKVLNLMLTQNQERKKRLPFAATVELAIEEAIKAEKSFVFDGLLYTSSFASYMQFMTKAKTSRITELLTELNLQYDAVTLVGYIADGSSWWKGFVDKDRRSYICSFNKDGRMMMRFDITETDPDHALFKKAQEEGRLDKFVATSRMADPQLGPQGELYLFAVTKKGTTVYTAERTW